MPREFTLNVNGRERVVTTDDDRPLLEVLREDFGLTGAKYGCGEGECGACTVLVDGVAVHSCITTVGDVGAGKIRTVESLTEGDSLHPAQQAFLEKQAMQCGYCVPGQILTAVALLEENAEPTREQIIAAMTNNICRCCNYPNILAAVEQAAGISE
jgi:aerobic-type carbon monoxide dehydrogenase small subunit (CoxS/CutS family)